MQNLPRKFNPGLNQDDKSLIEQYVVRLPLLKILLETIEDNTERPICQHHLYYGPRGRGKTMLMARVAAELRVNPKFSNNWIPIRLLEESYYEISNIGEFWLEVMSELTLSMPDENQENAQLSLKHLKENWSHPNLEQMAQATVLEQLDNINKKAIIMIENMHQLLDEIKDDDFGWAIRRVMQNEPRIMFLVTATTRFDNLDNAQQPFFEIFATSELPPLKRSEAARLWNSLTKSDKTEEQIAPLDILTGGSPRLLNIVAQFAKKNSIRELMENLTGLVDEYTEYFKSQLDVLAPKERRVFLALADLWSESTAKEIAERARMDIRSTSALLGRLEHKGALIVNAETPRRKTYLIAERLFCIYYKLRRERNQEALIEGLVKFMVDFYTPREIEDFRSLLSSINSLTEAESFALKKLSVMYTKTDSFALEIKNITDEVSPEFKKDIESISAKYEDGERAYFKGEFDESITELESIINQYGSREEPEIMRQVAKAMVNLAVTYGQQGEIEKALFGYENLIGRYQSREESEIIVLVAKAMDNQAVTYGLQGEMEKKLAGYENLIARYQAREEPEIMEQVARAMVNLAVTYGEQDEIEKALLGFEHLIDRYQSREEPEIIVQVIRSMFNQAVTYVRQGEIEKALAGYKNLIGYYQSRKESKIIVLVAKAMKNLAVIYGQQDEIEKALASYEHLIERYHSREEPEIMEQVATAMNGLAEAYWNQNDEEKVLANYENLIARYQAREEPEVMEQVARAMVNLAVTYGQQGEIKKELAGYEHLIERYQAREELEIIVQVAEAMGQQAVTYGEQDEIEKALLGFEHLIDRYQSREEPEIIVQVIRSMFNQAVTYVRQGEIEKALAGYKNLIGYYQSRKESKIIVLVAKAMKNLAVIYGQQDEIEKALASYEHLIERYHSREEPEIMEQVATAMNGLAEAYWNQNDEEKVLANYENLIARYQAREEPEIMEQVARAMVNLAVTYGQQGEIERAFVGCEKVIRLYQSRKESTFIVEMVALAMNNQSYLLAMEKKWHQAEQSYEKALSYLDDIAFPDQDIYSSIASLGMLLSKQAQKLSSTLQSCLVKLITEATRQPTSEERMTLAIGIGAVLPTEIALTIIQESQGNETLQPLIVALQLEKGEKVRVAEEVLEVAEDVRKRMEKMRKTFCNPEAP